jgi:hypothetical protein
MCAKIKRNPTSTSHRTRPKGVSTRDFHKVHWPYIPAWAVVGAGAIAAGAAEFGLGGAIAGGLSVAIATLALVL